MTCTIYSRISKDTLGDGHGVAGDLADLETQAASRGWQVTHRLSINIPCDPEGPHSHKQATARI